MTAYDTTKSSTHNGDQVVSKAKTEVAVVDEHNSLKYHLLDKNLTQKIDKIQARKRQLERTDTAFDLRKADEYVTDLELSRDLSQVIVHVDCDAFYAAVEELDRPELKEVPMAVGKGVLTTCNYHARKFGCRSGMAGFVAMKLCPQLICLPLNFEKYTAKAREVREVLAEYDPRFQSASMDEAYLNITQYCSDHRLNLDDVVTQLRSEIYAKAKITVSAGIGPNAKIAKIASNRNKPNGQFRVASDRATIMAFMHDLPTRKINGIGRVFERELDAIGIKTCGDIFPLREYLSKLFGEKAFQFLMQVYLGLGHTNVRPAEEYERKSVGTESTFRDMSGKVQLRDKLRWIAEELEKDLTRTQVKGRTLVLKIKLHTYEVLTRQTVLPKAVSASGDLYNYALPILSKLEREIPGMKLRLMGLRCTHLISTKKEEIDFFGMKRPLSASNTGPRKPFHSIQDEEVEAKGEEESEWEIWPADEFEEAARRERQSEFETMERLSQEYEQGLEHVQLQSALPQSSSADQSTTRSQQKASEEADRRLRQQQQRRQHTDIPAYPKRDLDPFSSPSASGATGNSNGQKSAEEETIWHCPICLRPQKLANEKEVNSHVDSCLSRQTIREVVADGDIAESGEKDGGEGKGGAVLAERENPGKGRGKRKNGGNGDGMGGRNKKFFFG
ncbi:MAG: hypothetical protein Q9167_000990 [Letrouitia subvulpina]